MRLNQLPPEILVNISLRLAIGDKLSLMLTCKRLKEVIYSRTFFDTVELPKDKEGTESILFEFRHKQDSGERVKILKLGLAHLSDQLFCEIPIIFPNVEYFEDLTSTNYDPRPETTLRNFIKWKDTLKVMNSPRKKASGLIYMLLEKHVFTCLDRLSLSYHAEDGGISPKLSEYLKNAPFLTQLQLSNCMLTIDDIENIHCDAQGLKTFEIEKIGLLITSEETLSQDITPASSVTDLYLLSVAIIDETCLFLEYLIRKYTNLNHLFLLPCFQSKSSKLFFPHQTREELGTNPDVAAKAHQMNETFKAYKAHGSGILSNLPATLEELVIDWMDIKNGMSIFTPKFSNLRYLNYFSNNMYKRDEFKQPKQIDTLENLTALKELRIVLEPSIHQYNHQGPLSTSITNLFLTIKGKGHRDDMDIGWLFEMFPSINELTIPWSGSRLIGYKGTQPRLCPNLTKICFGPIVPHPKLFTFIRDSAPNLRHLDYAIYGTLKMKTAPANINVLAETPATKDGLPYYEFDLLGLHLDRFQLFIDLRRMEGEKLENVYLCLECENGVKSEFVILGEYSIILPRNHGLSFKPASSPMKAKIHIKFSFINIIAINSKISIDPKKNATTSDFQWS